MKNAQQYKNLTIGEFTKAADTYESNYTGIYEMCKEDYPHVEEEHSKIQYHDLLDYGCGTGPMNSILHEKDSTKHYVGLDPTPKMIEVASAKNLEGVDWAVGDCENLPFEDETFDVIICINIFRHYPNPQN
ncbi:MAG: class I SAM-dependent methyltransferase [Lachnospiraceae bacterium]|nr:class I SAM-dependent methyltransferase [Lachnospiraceae bacterium]